MKLVLITYYNDTKNGCISFKKEEELDLGDILKRNPEHKLEDQTSAIKDMQKLYKRWEEVIKFCSDYNRMVSEGKCKSIMETISKY